MSMRALTLSDIISKHCKLYEAIATTVGIMTALETHQLFCLLSGYLRAGVFVPVRTSRSEDSNAKGL